MKTRHVITEGPDDVTALRSIAIAFWSATVGGGAVGRRERLVRDEVTVDVHVTSQGESGIAQSVATQFRQSTDKPDDDRVAVLFDPDVRSVGQLEGDIQGRLDQAGFTTNRAGGDWTVNVGGRPMSLRIIDWRSPDGVVAGLKDEQNLDRLICAVAARAFPGDAPIVERWLAEARAAGKDPCWKAARHLWCALVAQKQNESNAAAQFLHQDTVCRPHAKKALEDVSLATALSWLFMP